ncbi:hypothetical protein LTR08_007710 [Meristemomyces frigidus]|nr:hypothetical protein LTR08_007710 [Meristemomyces frigidus]
MLKEDHEQLKRHYEEERKSYDHDSNSFVLVLIAGDSYVFDDDLVSGGAKGGQRAGRLLDDAVKLSLRDKGLQHCRIIVRVYVNLAGLSKHLSRANLVRPGERSLASFAAGFTSSRAMFDFVDAGELIQSANFKIGAMFRQFVDNAQCRHIYFAGCHSVRYVKELIPYASDRERITLVRNYAFHTGFNRLDLHIEEFSGIFRDTPLTLVGERQVGKPTSPPVEPASTAQMPDATSCETGADLCRFFQFGICRWGEECKYLHVFRDADSRPTTSTDSSSGSEISIGWI